MPRIITCALLLLAVVFSSQAFAGDDPIEGVLEGCAMEIDSYCSQVTPGEGRLMACFYAHEDKLSAGCINAVYDAAVALEEAIDAFIYLATACETDIDTLCADVEAGEGRILNCLMAEEESLSESCAQAMVETEE